MNTRKMRWLSCGRHVVNLDNVRLFSERDGGVYVFFGNGENDSAFLDGLTIDDIRHYLKYGKPKRR